MEEHATLRELRKRQTREELARVALRLFHDRGYDATTVDDIAEQAGYGRRTFFRHFASKDDVAFADADQQLSALADRLAKAPSDVELLGFAEEALADTVRDLVAIPFFVEARALWFREGALRRRYVDLLVSWERAVLEFLATRSDRLTPLSAAIAASTLVGVVRGVLAAQPDSDVVDATLAEGFLLVREGLAGRV